MDLLGLGQKDVARIAAMLRDYEAGTLFKNDDQAELPRRAPIETYTGLVVDTIPASTGEPTSGTVAIYGADVDTGLMKTDPEFTITAYSLWDVSIDSCSWVHLARDPFSGFYFVYSIPGGKGCTAYWYCVVPVDDGGGSGSGGGGGSGDSCACDLPETLTLTINVSSGTCTCMDGQTVTLTNGIGNLSACDTSISFVVTCQDGSYVYEWVSGIIDSPNNPLTVVSCDPVHLTGFMSLDFFCSGAVGAVSITA